MHILIVLYTSNPNWDFHVKNVSIKLQHDADISWWIIMFIKQFDIPVKVPCDAYKSWWVISFTRHIDLELVWKFKKVRKQVNIKQLLDVYGDNLPVKL